MGVNHRISKYRKVAAFIVAVLLVVLSTVSLLPLIETDAWWIRFLDFPRLQFALVIIALMAIYLVLQTRPGRWGWVAIGGAVVALGYHVYKLHPYTRLVESAVVAQADCQEDRALRVMIANVKRGNERADVFLSQVAAMEPDLLLVMETDAWWDEQLSILHDDFSHRMQSIPVDHAAFYGMHLFSKLELISPEFRFFFGADTPTAVAQVQLRGGEVVGFIGLHPRPPHFSQPSTMRDAHVLQAALIAREWDAPTIVAGDFNAVPWERVTRRAMRIGELLDPRVGRGLFPTYDTESFLMSWPLDQILIQSQFTLNDFRTLPDFGSDHRAVAVTLCHQPNAQQSAPEILANDLAEAEASIEAARRLSISAGE